ncbi:hypothetical protein COHA_003676 [Chlorella ohadii]|uniref:GST N-terminal domain-containing protein n=1 Tax=Chlorella ohadii TaxID=2649997 RepID=A0AAD5H6K8_9CHLO|nr:hypothetical protein COHA_003676 [Chlorella ohadii]
MPAETEKGLHLYAAGTPKGHKPLIALEELGIPYTLHKIDLLAADQRKPDYLRINPAGRIPALGAILFYLAEKDGSGRLLPSDAAGKAEALAWIFCQSVSERGC